MGESRKSRVTIRGMVAVRALFSLLALTLAAATAGPQPAAAPAAADAPPSAQTPQPAVTAQPALSDLSRSLQDLAARVSPSVVQIFVTGYAPPDDEDRAATGEPQLERSSGSGVVVDADGFIVTNAHVVENATRIEVELPLPRPVVRRAGRSSSAAAASPPRTSSRSIRKPTSRSSRWTPTVCRRCHLATRMRCARDRSCSLSAVPSDWSRR